MKNSVKALLARFVAAGLALSTPATASAQTASPEATKLPIQTIATYTIFDNLHSLRISQDGKHTVNWATGVPTDTDLKVYSYDAANGKVTANVVAGPYSSSSLTTDDFFNSDDEYVASDGSIYGNSCLATLDGKNNGADTVWKASPPDFKAQILASAENITTSTLTACTYSNQRFSAPGSAIAFTIMQNKIVAPNGSSQASVGSQLLAFPANNLDHPMIIWTNPGTANAANIGFENGVPYFSMSPDAYSLPDAIAEITINKKGQINPPTVIAKMLSPGNINYKATTAGYGYVDIDATSMGVIGETFMGGTHRDGAVNILKGVAFKAICQNTLPPPPADAIIFGHPVSLVAISSDGSYFVTSNVNKKGLTVFSAYKNSAGICVPTNIANTSVSTLSNGTGLATYNVAIDETGTMVFALAPYYNNKTGQVISGKIDLLKVTPAPR